MNPQQLVKALSPVLAALLLAACGGESGTSDTPNVAAKSLTGTVHGGQSPVSGSTVTLYAAGKGLNSASVLATGTSDSSGSFSLSGYTCPSGNPPIYLVASGGNPGLASGTNNTALQLMAALGACDTTPSTVNLNEVTTVAAAYALNGFIGAAGCIDCSGSLPQQVINVHGNATGLSNASSTAGLLASVSAGSASPPLPTASACAAGTPPVNCGTEQRLDALANSLAACVNSASGSSAQCTELFACATPGSTFSSGACTVPGGSALATDTLTAIVEIARNPGQVAIAGIYDVATRNAVFSPTLSAAPTDWTLALTHTGGGLNDSFGVAIDASGNIWVANHGGNSLSEFNALGTALSPNSGYTGGGLNGPYGLAIDASGNIWVPNPISSNSLSEFSGVGTALSPSSGYTGGGLNANDGIAIDASGNVWLNNYSGNSLSAFNAAGTALSPSSGYTGGGLSAPYGLAIDASGNIWVPNSGNSSLSEFSNAGTALSPSSGYTGGGLNGPTFVAIDPSGNVWIPNRSGNSLSEFNAAGTALSPSSGYAGGGLASPFGIAIDASGNVWVGNSAGSVSEFNASGTALSPTGGYTSGAFNHSDTLAIDVSGNVWVASAVSNSLTELVGAAAPTRTPVVSAITKGFTP